MYYNTRRIMRASSGEQDETFALHPKKNYFPKHYLCKNVKRKLYKTIFIFKIIWPHSPLKKNCLGTLMREESKSQC